MPFASGDVSIQQRCRSPCPASPCSSRIGDLTLTSPQLPNVQSANSRGRYILAQGPAIPRENTHADIRACLTEPAPASMRWCWRGHALRGFWAATKRPTQGASCRAPEAATGKRENFSTISCASSSRSGRQRRSARIRRPPAALVAQLERVYRDLDSQAARARRVSVDFVELSIRELSRNFGRRRALSRVSIDCHAGEILGLLDRMAPASPALAIVSTLALPSSGDVLSGARPHTTRARAPLL